MKLKEGTIHIDPQLLFQRLVALGTQQENFTEAFQYVTGRCGSPSIGFAQGWGDVNTTCINGDTLMTQTPTASVEHSFNLWHTY